MAKAKTAYACTECGGTSSKWQGQCPQCGAWNTLVETIAATPSSRFLALAGAPSAVRAAGDRRDPGQRAHGDRHRGIRPRARRRAGVRRRGAAGRRSGHRQVDPAAAGDGGARDVGQARPRALRHRRGIGRAGGAPRAAPRAGQRRGRAAGRGAASGDRRRDPRRCSPASSSSIRSRRSIPKRWSPRRAASRRCASAPRS